MENSEFNRRMETELGNGDRVGNMAGGEPIALGRAVPVKHVPVHALYTNEGGSIITASIMMLSQAVVCE